MTEPALTAEEWEELSGKPGLHEWIHMENPDHRRMMLLQKFEQDNLHGVAAVALHGQAFGFTRKHRDYLRFLESRSMGLDQIGLRDIADLIEALLPPEKK